MTFADDIHEARVVKPNHVVMFSGGVGSWATAKRAAMAVGAENVTLLFADTVVESNDLYRFLLSAASNIAGCDPPDDLLSQAGSLPPVSDLTARKTALADLRARATERLLPLVWVADGRTPFEVFRDDRFLGNSRLANCSMFLKIKPCRAWLDENHDPADTILYVGIDWSEVHRLPAIENGWKPYEVRSPLTGRPFLSKEQVLAWLRAEGIRLPAAYAEGFPHNNCMSQGCVRGGQAYWQTLLRERPDAYAYAEAGEADLRAHLDADVSILKERSQGVTSPLTLREFREQIEAQGTFDSEEWGGCGCFVDEPEAA